MNSFFEWLSGDGYMQEIFVVIVLLILLAFIIILVAKYVSIDIKGVKSKDTKDKKENKSKSSNSTANNNLFGYAKSTVVASQDYKIISLIVQAHANRVRDEIKQYCTKNGLDKKDKEEYMVYVDEKKIHYMNELREMVRREYVSYDIISATDVYRVLDEVKERVMTKLEKMYISLRDISVQEHGRINKERFETFDIYLNKFISWHNCEYKNEDDEKMALTDLIKNYRENCEKLVINERIDILDKQVQKIDMTRKELVDIILTSIMQKLEELVSKECNDADGTNK